jgi:hypothetical protein
MESIETNANYPLRQSDNAAPPNGSKEPAKDKPKDKDSSKDRQDRPKKDGPVVQVRAWTATFEWDANVSDQLDLPCSSVKNETSGKSDVLCTSKSNLQEIKEPSAVVTSPEEFKKLYW